MKKKRNAFTLIELLAVIVVLAIIALIATPIVMNTIKKSKKGAAERSADSFVKQVETAVTTERLNGNIIEDGEYEITSDGNLCKDKSASCSDDQKIKIEMNGTKPTSGKVKITNGNAEISTKLTVGDYDVKYNPESKKYEATEKGSTSSTVVYGKEVIKRSAYSGKEEYNAAIEKSTINIGDIIDLSDTTKYTTDPTALEEDSYLKHVVDKNNKVTESYACAIFNDKEYCLKGGDSSFYGWAEDEADYTGNMLTFKNFRDEKLEWINCSFKENNSTCYGGAVDLTARSDGRVNACVFVCCFVQADGSSYCKFG